MPFPIVYGVPKDTPQDVLTKLRRDIVAALVKANVPQKWIRPLFPADLLDEPKEEADGASTIYVKLDTGMLHDKPDAKVVAERLLRPLAQLIWDAFSGKYEVEAFIGDLNTEWKVLIEAKA